MEERGPGITPDGSVTVVEEEGWLKRIMNSIKAVLFGVALFIVSFPLLWWNEGRSVQRALDLEEGAGAVVSVSADKVDPANEGKLVHLTGNAETKETLQDAEFGVSVSGALKLKRTVEMYQWKEEVTTKEEKELGGKVKKTKTYNYEKVWSDDLYDSSGFKNQEKKNPSSMTYKSKSFSAQKVTVGAFTLSEELLDSINNFEELAPESPVLEKIKLNEPAKAVIDSGAIYISPAGNPQPTDPKIGDLRVKFSVAKPTIVSIFAKQFKDTFTSYTTKSGGELIRLELGAKTAAQMFQKAQEENVMLTWILRLLGFLLMAFGIYIVFKPLAVVADVIPFLGSILAGGLGIFAALISFALSFITIAVAWIFYRPLVGIILLAVAIGSVVGAKFLFKKKELPKEVPAGISQ
ncbi:MAG: hypothetical protein Kow0090_07330 [Myxococcota bacterium]